jgi:hypothetical protein
MLQMAETLMDVDAVRKKAQKVIVLDFPQNIIKYGCYAYFYNGVLFIDTQHRHDKALYSTPLSTIKKSALTVTAAIADRY